MKFHLYAIDSTLVLCQHVYDSKLCITEMNLGSEKSGCEKLTISKPCNDVEQEIPMQKTHKSFIAKPRVLRLVKAFILLYCDEI